MQKKSGILHRSQCNFALDRLQSQLASNGSAITGYKTMKTVCIKCLFWPWPFRQLTGDQKKSWVCHELFKRNNLGKVKITDLGTVRSLMLAVGNWQSAQKKQSGKNQNKAHPLLTSKQCVHCV